MKISDRLQEMYESCAVCAEKMDAKAGRPSGPLQVADLRHHQEEEHDVELSPHLKGR